MAKKCLKVVETYQQNESHEFVALHPCSHLFCTNWVDELYRVHAVVTRMCLYWDVLSGAVKPTMPRDASFRAP